ncbi:PAS domain-containing protein [Aneurinibacillus sp. REN35]|uniref:PAS domain-containing protein n=1 Tax=Aneurinibacillus sp. REN35 TaxID=3237286 RepID=UPI00352831E0
MVDTVLEQLDTGILMIDTNLHITFMNAACERILGIRRDELLGHNIDEFLDQPSQHLRGLQQTVEEKQELLFDVMPYRRGENYKYLRQQTRLLREEGQIIGAMAELRDITGYVEKERELQTIIRDMTVHIVPVTDTIGALPLQPIIGTSHKDILLERTLTICMGLHLEKLAVDLTAISSIEDEFAHTLMQMISALRLVGIQVIITGIRPEVAMTLIDSAPELDDCPSFARLSQALAYFEEV